MWIKKGKCKIMSLVELGGICDSQLTEVGEGDTGASFLPHSLLNITLYPHAFMTPFVY